jgi:hypothetical protein
MNKPIHFCHCECGSTNTSGFDPAYIRTTRNGVDMLCSAMTVLRESGSLEAPDMALWEELQRALRRGALSFGLSAN